MTALRALAQQSTRHGYFDHGATLSVDCPKCGERVTVTYSMWTTDGKGKRMSKIAQLRGEVYEHLSWECGQVANVPLVSGSATG